MQQVTGWLTEDQKFFAQHEEAALYEAGKYLEAALVAFAGPKANYERFMFVVNNLRGEIGSYLDAAKALEEREEANYAAPDGKGASGSGESVADVDTPDIGIGADDEANEQQPAGGPDAVSDMGTRSLAEEIRNLGAGDGSRGRRADAQGFFSSADMAAMAAPEVGEARHVDGDTSVWDEVDAHLEGGGGAPEERPTGSPSELVLRNIARYGLGGQPSRRNPNDG